MMTLTKNKNEITRADIQKPVVQKLHRRTPYMMDFVSGGMFSIARRSGGITYNGSHYVYQPATDTLVPRRRGEGGRQGEESWTAQRKR